MHRYLTLLALSAIGLTARAQQMAPNLNLDFEQIVRQTGQPARWTAPADAGYVVRADSVGAQQGRYALRLQSTGQPSERGFGMAFVKLPVAFKGKTVTLAGYLKTENVQNGYAGLWLREDSSSGTLLLDNMSKQKVQGTTGWQPYSITLPLMPGVKSLVLGGLLTGTGRAWLDELTLTVDDKPWWQAPIKAKPTFKAEQDTAFSRRSGIVLGTLDKQQLDNLAVLCHVWGFVKYYHPAVARGEFNLDAELLRILPRVVASSSIDARSQVLSAWLASLGPVPPCAKCQEPDPKTIRLQPDLAWLTDKRQFNSDLRRQLDYLRRNRNQGSHYYVSAAPGVGNPHFEHENPYPYVTDGLPDDGLRVLALYRYWNMIAYFFPYRYAIGEDWQQVLLDFLPRFVDARTPEQYRLSALALIARIHDTHANLSDPVLQRYWGLYYTPAQVRFVEGKAVVTGYFDPQLGPATSLLPGDVVELVDGRPVPELIAERRPLTPASNEPTQLRNIARDLLRGSTEQVQVVVRRDGQRLPLTIDRYVASKLNLMLNYGTPDKAATPYRPLPGNIGYLALGTLTNEKLPEVMRAVTSTKGLIIDIRNYPADFVTFTLTGYLLRKPAPFVQFSRMDLANPGAFLLSLPKDVEPRASQFYPGKVVVLVNELTQSNAEYTTMALRTAPNATVIGSTTAGADGNVSTILLPGNLSTHISGIGVYYPDGRETQRIGIVPDIEIKPTIQGIKEGRDEVLERAIELIKSEK